MDYEAIISSWALRIRAQNTKHQDYIRSPEDMTFLIVHCALCEFEFLVVDSHEGISDKIPTYSWPPSGEDANRKFYAIRYYRHGVFYEVHMLHCRLNGRNRNNRPKDVLISIRRSSDGFTKAFVFKAHPRRHMNTNDDDDDVNTVVHFRTHILMELIMFVWCYFLNWPIGQVDETGRRPILRSVSISTSWTRQVEVSAIAASRNQMLHINGIRLMDQVMQEVLENGAMVFKTR
ncbi:hypothetical protein ACOME3_005491 [Neoechinorhynchus agilis]